MPRLTIEQATEALACRPTSLCAETDTLSAGVGYDMVVPGLDNSGVVPQDEFSLEQEEALEPLQEDIIVQFVFVH